MRGIFFSKSIELFNPEKLCLEQTFFKLSGEGDGGREPEWCCLNIEEPRELHPSAKCDLNPFVFMSQGGTVWPNVLS